MWIDGSGESGIWGKVGRISGQRKKGLVRKPGKGQGWWGRDMDFKGLGEFGGLDEKLMVGGGQRLWKGPPMKYSESA